MKVMRSLMCGGVLILGACSGFEPFEPPNNRDNPQTPGLFTGKEGAFVIYRRVEAPAPSGDQPEKTSKPSQAAPGAQESDPVGRYR